MINYFKKPYRWAILFTILLLGASSYVMLDTFVIPKSYEVVVTKASTLTQASSDTSTDSTSTTASTTTTNTTSASTSDALSDTVTDAATDTSSDTTVGATTDADSKATSSSDTVITDTSYKDENIKISIETIRVSDANVYVADIQLSDAKYLKTAFANNTYGRNVKAATSKTASQNNAIFAIDGDFYGFRDYGYVLRNGVLYRDKAGEDDALVIDKNGDFSVIKESETSIDSLDLNSIWQILSFGPGLIKDEQIVVDSSSEVARSIGNKNPRTAIGQISALHYIVVVCDGRTNESAGLSLLDLAKVMADYGCTTAYNLDGGGSATMYFNGKVVNVPTDGRFFGEREVSDIVYLGY